MAEIGLFLEGLRTGPSQELPVVFARVSDLFDQVRHRVDQIDLELALEEAREHLLGVRTEEPLPLGIEPADQCW